MTDETKRLEELEREVSELREYVRAIGKAVGVVELDEAERAELERARWFTEGDTWRERLRERTR